MRSGIHYQSIFSRILLNQRKISSPFVDAVGSKRFYYVDRDKVNHFKRRGWTQNPLFVLIKIGLLGCGVYYWNLETVPYTKRRHLVFLSSHLEKIIGNWLFEGKKSNEYKGKILASSHPDSIRVQKIGQKIIGAMHKGIRLRKDAYDQCFTAHLEEFEWEFIVVDVPTTNAFCSAGGKIVVHRGLLRQFKTDDEIAITIGHEVGHAVARHPIDGLFGPLPHIILVIFMSLGACEILEHLLWSSRSQRNEIEADYIGLLLSASAGYDPQVAPQRYKQIKSEPGFKGKYMPIHPPGHKRAQLLSDPKVMEEALSIYREASPPPTQVFEYIKRMFGHLFRLN